MKIRLYTLFISLFITATSFSQNLNYLNGFKYVIVSPMIYKDGSRDTYDIEAKAISTLGATGLQCLNSENSKN
jgi:hypothetical protein